VVDDVSVKQKKRGRILSYGLLLFSTLVIYSIAQAINSLLINYELSSMYISFCAGFILFTPLVSLLLHPLIFTELLKKGRLKLPLLIVNFGLVLVVQCLFFLIWITDAIVVYSLYVDQNSFLAKSFSITSVNHGNLSVEFFWANLFLAWFFALLSLVLGVMPCLIARIDNQGVVNNFVASFTYAKQYKTQFAFAAFCLAMGVVIPLLYMKYTFLLIFPLVIVSVFLYLSRSYVTYTQITSRCVFQDA